MTANICKGYYKVFSNKKSNIVRKAGINVNHIFFVGLIDKEHE